MTIARQTLVACVMMASFAALAACQSTGPSGPGAAPTGVEGEWMSSDGVSTSRFSGGSFSTTANDTGKMLAQGTYTVAGATVSINGTSVIRQSPIAFNCLMASSSQLNCTSSAGQNFTLIRRA